MVIGFIAGYVVKAIRRYIRLPKDIEGFGIIFIIPVLTTFVTGIIYSVVLMRLFYIIQNSIIVEFADIKGPFAAIIGVLLGSMMAYDMGGPINKLAYVVGLLTVVTGETSTVMAAIMAAGMTPPLVTGLATLIGRRFFTLRQKQLGKLAILKGLVFITEGAIPFAQTSPKTVLPSIVIGSAISGGLSMLFGCYTMVPQGGIAAILIPDMVHKPLLYLFSIILGTIIGAVIMLILKYRQNIKSATSLG
jgi:PTS system fructose-specific IIC component